MENKQSFIGRGISNILKLIGCFVVFLFVLGYIINYVENFVPYNIIPRAKLDNPNKFNTGYVYDEINNLSDWRGTIKSKTMEVYEKTGIQMYYLYIEIPEEITTKDKALSYINDIIKDKFDDPYGFYLVNAHPKEYKNGAYVSLYNEYIYGDYVSTFMDSKALAIYNAAFKKYYNGSFGTYYSSEECAARGLIVAGDRLIHPFLSLFVAGLKLVFIAGCVVLLVIVLRKINRKHRNKEILDTPMKDLVAEHAEDIRDKYE